MKSVKLNFLLLFAYQAIAQVQIDRLTVEYVENPLGIQTSAPQFSWTFVTNSRNQLQTGYEIEVTDRPEKNSASIWTTGKVNSSQNTNLVYKGSALQSFTRYFWRVRVYDQTGRSSDWSKSAWFETAMLHQQDWQAKWIGDGSKQFVNDEDFYRNDPMPIFRKNFSVLKKIKSARLYISGLGYYEAYLNGKKIGDHVLDPGWTNYEKNVLYSVYDITPFLKWGENIAGVMLGNGWFNPLPLRLFSKFNLREAQQTGRPCLRAEYHLLYSDGTSEKIITDESWLTTSGPVTRNSVYLGEHYDARLETPWLTAKIDPVKWRKATATYGPRGVMKVQMQPPVRVTKIVKPVRINELPSRVFIVDMGQNFAGVARIRVQGEAGATIKLRYGELLHPDGTLNVLTSTAGQIKEIWQANGGPGSPPTAWQEDKYILKGRGMEEWAPRFTFHGFRYVEITGWPGIPDIKSIDGLRMNSDVHPVGEFSCSNPLFNKIHEAINWTFLSNVFSVQSDCPAREKMGYGADIVVTSDAYMYNFDMFNFYNKTLHDFANDQQDDGGITELAPFTGIADQGYGGRSGPLGWELVFPLLQKRLFDFYGDRTILEELYPRVQKQMEFMQSHAVSGLFHWDIGDHEAIDTKAEAFSAAAFYYHHALLAREIALILKHEDSTKYSKLARRIKEDIISKYYLPGTGRFDNATQSAQLFALWYDLSPEKDKTIQVLLDEFKRHNNHVSSGIFGIKMMFDVLSKIGRNDLAFELANQKDFPGWGYMLSKGATTLWESWNYSDNVYSHNHPMFGSIDEWFYRSLLGINSASPGFEKIKIKPQPAGDLSWAKGSYRSVRGLIESDWKIRGNQFIWRVQIPPNTHAELWIPGKSKEEVKESDEWIAVRKDVKPKSYEQGYTVVEVGSGIYTFESLL